jgi:hypothetical protein
MKYLLQTTSDRNVWEKVDEYTYSHRSQALTDKADGQRYTGNYIIVNEAGQHEIQVADLTSNELSIVMRFLSITVNGNTSYPGGYVREPACIVFQPKNPKQATIIRMADGTIYKKVTAA